MGTVVDDAASVEFHAFFERHYAELARLAHLLTGEADAADDLAADALLALWHRWDRVRAADHPVAYARGVVANLARTRIRSAVRERRRISLFWSQREEKTENPDIAGVVDVQEALRRLPTKSGMAYRLLSPIRPVMLRWRTTPRTACAARISLISSSMVGMMRSAMKKA